MLNRLNRLLLCLCRPVLAVMLVVMLWHSAGGDPAPALALVAFAVCFTASATLLAASLVVELLLWLDRPVAAQTSRLLDRVVCRGGYLQREMSADGGATWQRDLRFPPNVPCGGSAPAPVPPPPLPLRVKSA